MTRDCAGALETLLGTRSPDRPAVLHGAAVFAPAAGAYAVLRVGALAPESPLDRFAVAVARARADVILTSGRNLRDEPDAPALPPPDAVAWLGAWRRALLGRTRPAQLAVLTRSGDVDPAHPALHAEVPPLLLTTGAGAQALSKRGVAPDAERLVGDDFDAARWLDVLLARPGVETVLIEAGPSTAAPLYAPPGRVDELVLSVCPAQSVDPGARGAPLLGEGEIAGAGLECVHTGAHLEPSGSWTFRRYLRAGPRGSVTAG